MKHINNIENFILNEKNIKKNSEQAKNNELNKLADFMVNIFEKLKNMDREQYYDTHYESFVKKFYTDNDYIHIYYNLIPGEKYKIGTIAIKKENENISLIIEMKKYKMDKNSQYIFDFFTEKLKPYKRVNVDNTAMYDIPLSQDQIIDLLEDINIYFDANKYNL